MSDKDSILVAHFRESDCMIQTVEEHLLGTAKLSRKFASKINLGDLGELTGLMHDLGKGTELFNRYIKSAVGLIKPTDHNYYKLDQKVDHASAGAQFIYNNLIIVNELIKSIVALLIKSHHGGLIDCLTPAGENNFYEKMNKDQLETRLGESLEKCSEEILAKVNDILNSDLESAFMPHLEKIKKYREPKKVYFMLGLIIRYLFSCLIDADRQDTADFDNPQQLPLRHAGKYTHWEYLIEKLENHIVKFKVKSFVDTVRTEISSKCFEFGAKRNNIYQLTVPTGGGKTLSSLRFALKHAATHNMDHIFYIVPFTTIIDQNAETIRTILENELEVGTIVLEHHSNLTQEEDTEKTKLLSENWDAPIVFTTMVQLLETLFNGGTRSVRRMHQLASSVIIFDEIQTLDVKMVHMFNSAIEFLVDICNSTVVLCTATQPLLNRIDPSEYSLKIGDHQKIIPNEGEVHKVLSRVEVKDITKPGGWTDNEIAEIARRELEKNQNVLIIVNTKKSAISLMENFTEGIYQSFHLSTDMCPKHRMDKLDEMITALSRSKKCDEKPIICISTALIEAGVNIDFDVVIRFSAGLDSIVQAAGRCNRNGLMKRKGLVYIVNSANEDLGMLRVIKRGAEITERVLREFREFPHEYDNDLMSPASLEKYFQYYFYSRKDEMNYTTKIPDYGISDSLYSLLSSNNRSLYAARGKNHTKPIVLPFSFKSAGNAFKVIEGYTQGVIVPYGNEGIELITKLCEANYINDIYQLLKFAQKYSVNLYRYQLEELVKAGIIDEVQKGFGIYYVKNKENYDLVLGLIKETRTNDTIMI